MEHHFLVLFVVPALLAGIYLYPLSRRLKAIHEEVVEHVKQNKPEAYASILDDAKLAVAEIRGWGNKKVFPAQHFLFALIRDSDPPFHDAFLDERFASYRRMRSRMLLTLIISVVIIAAGLVVFSITINHNV